VGHPLRTLPALNGDAVTVQSARDLRKQLTDAERRLWYLLRRKQLAGFRFRRQAPIGRYIADFACFAERLIIEVDGGQHADAQAYDEARTAWLDSEGFRVLRFWNNDVLGNQEAVLQTILDALRR
jgi:very-short-patch-repair endonuclease